MMPGAPNPVGFRSPGMAGGRTAAVISQSAPAQFGRMLGQVQSGRANPLAALTKGAPQAGQIPKPAAPPAGLLGSLQLQPQPFQAPQPGPPAGLLQSLMPPPTAMGGNVPGDYTAAGFRPRAFGSPGQANPTGGQRVMTDIQTGHPMLNDGDKQRMMEIIQGWAQRDPQIVQKMFNPPLGGVGQSAIGALPPAEMQRMIDSPSALPSNMLENPNMLAALQKSLGLFNNSGGDVNYSEIVPRSMWGT